MGGEGWAVDEVRVGGWVQGCGDGTSRGGGWDVEKGWVWEGGGGEMEDWSGWGRFGGWDGGGGKVVGGMPVPSEF